MSVPKLVPPTKLWGDEEEGWLIVLRCDCGYGVEYPGHPDDRSEVTCKHCGTVWAVQE